MFLSRYQDRPSTLKVEHEIVTNMVIDLEGQQVTKPRKGTVHSLNEFDITVWEDGEVTARRKYYARSDPQSTFPNMTVDGGAITLPIDDLVEFLLARITPAELADGIIGDDEARAALLDKLAERYNEPGFTDADRREFLTKVQQQVYAVAIGHAVERLNNVETDLRAKSHRSRWEQAQLGHYSGLYERYRETLSELREAGKLDDEGIQRRLSMLTTPDSLKAYTDEISDPITRESVGAQWSESRDYWRKRLEECFPEPREEGGAS